MPNNSALPVETLDDIVEELISGLPEGTEDDSVLPRRQRQLAPLLYVCKIWRAVTERHMYKIISVGKTNGSATDGIALTKRRQKKGFRTAKKLLDTLRAHPRLAAYVDALELATMKRKNWGLGIDWTHVNTQIIQACPNLKHVDNLAIYDPYLKNLTTVLKKKSLVSFSLTHDCIFADVCKSELSLYDILPSWPKLQSLHVDGFHLSEVQKGETILCCPELREIKVVNCEPRGHHYDLLRSFTDCVTKFYITSNIKESWEQEAFYRCLRTWSSTLTHLRICVMFGEHVNIEGMDYSPLWDVVSTMTELQELQIYAESHKRSVLPSKLELGFDLPKLERLCIAPHWDFSWLNETAKHLTALRHVVCCYRSYGFSFSRDIKRICEERDIKLEEWNKKWKNSKFPGFVL